MRKLMFGAAIVAAMIAPAIAHADDTKGTIGVHYDNLDPQGSGSNVDQYGLDGAVSHDFSNGWTVQGDATNDRLHASGASFGTSYGAVSLGMRNSQYSFYGFLGLGDLEATSSTDLGIGGQMFLNNIVLDGSIGYADFADAHAHVTQAGIDGTYFFNDNLGLTAQYGHTSFDSSGPDTDSNIYGVSGAYRMASSPVTFSLGYQKIDGDVGDANVWHVGVAWDFGTSSLHDRATTGPSWNGASQLYTQSLYGIL